MVINRRKTVHTLIEKKKIKKGFKPIFFAMQYISLQNWSKHGSCSPKAVLTMKTAASLPFEGTVQCSVPVTKTHQKVLAISLISKVMKSCSRLAVKLEGEYRPYKQINSEQ